jgi:hypothetical protein
MLYIHFLGKNPYLVVASKMPQIKFSAGNNEIQLLEVFYFSCAYFFFAYDILAVAFKLFCLHHITDFIPQIFRGIFENAEKAKSINFPSENARFFKPKSYFKQKNYILWLNTDYCRFNYFFV